MKKTIVCAAAIIFLGKSLLCAGIVIGGEYDKGRDLYNNKCLICHGIKGDGNGPAAASLNTEPPDFTRTTFWQNNADKKIAETIRNGYGMMPSFDLKTDEIKAIIDYMSHTFKRN